MRYLSALPLRLRLALSFALVVVLLILVGGFALIQLASLNRDTRDIAESWLPRVRHVATIKIATGAIRVAQFQHLASEPAEEDGAVGIEDKAAAAEAEVEKQRTLLTRTIAAYEPLISTDDERAQFDEFRKQWEAYEASSQIFMDVMKSGAKDVAMSMMTEQARVEFDAGNAALDRLIEISAEGVGLASARSAANYRTTLTLVIVAILVSVGVAAAAAWLLIRQIMRQLGGDPADVKHTVEQIADGELGGQIRLAPGDRDSLLAATKRMQGELLKLAGAQQEMHAQHAAGALAHRIDTAQFRGIYGELATAVNTLASTHIDVSRRAVEVIQRYALGDFSVDMDRLPGEQARITDAMDGVKHQLGAIKDETLKLADAAGRGEFAVRGDAGRFDHAFRDIIDGLNRLMATSEQGLQGVGRVLGALATGDLTKRMDGQFQGMFATLRDNANESIAQLSGIVRQIKKSAELIDAAAGEIASGNQDLSARTESQASSLEETAAAVEQLAGTVNQNAANAKEANGLAANAGDVAGRGGAVVDQVVSTMGAISVSSKKIADIIGVIDGIAFQTNILALNAAVEAARAGDQGRGFAVVASEVRALAQRSADAAKEIKALIGESVKNVTSGTELVSRAGQTMHEIVIAVKRVNDIMGEIAGASSEQSTGISQVNQAIVNIDATTQQNAALVEQAAAAARSLKEQASELTETVGTFRL